MGVNGISRQIITPLRDVSTQCTVATPGGNSRSGQTADPASLVSRALSTSPLWRTLTRHRSGLLRASHDANAHTLLTNEEDLDLGSLPRQRRTVLPILTLYIFKILTWI